MPKLRILILLTAALLMGPACAIECGETPDSNEIVINNTLHYDFVGPTGGYTEHIEKKICRAEYVQPCEWKFDYSPNYEELSIKDCYVLHGGKKLGCNEPMKRKDVYEWSGTSTLAVSSRSCINGDVYRILLSEKRRLSEENAVCFYMGDYDYIEYQKFEVEYPLDSEVSYTSSFGREPEIIEGEDTKLYVWEIENQKPAIYEDSMPPTKEVFDYICISSHSNFSSYGGYVMGLFEDKLAAFEDVKNISDGIVGNSTGEEAIEKLYEWVKDYIQYVPLEYGVLTGVEPHTPEEILTRGNGDCKDQSVLLSALLRAQGFEAEPVLFGLANDTPVMQSFNHVITKVVYGNKTIWMDPTCQSCPYGFLPRSEYGMYVLPFMSSYELERLPAYRGFDMYMNLNVSVVVHEDGSSRFTGVFEIGDVLFASQFRSAYRMLSGKNTDELMSQYLGSVMCREYEDPKIEILNLDDGGENLLLNISVVCKDLVEVGNNTLVFKPKISSGLDDYSLSTNRSNDYYAGRKSLIEGNLRVTFPRGYVVEGESGEFNVTESYFHTIGRKTIDGNVVDSYMSLYLSERVPKEEYNEFRSQYLGRESGELRAEKPVPKKPETMEESQDYGIVIILATIMAGVVAVVVILFLYKRSQPEGPEKLDVMVRDLIKDGESPEEIRKAMKDAGYKKKEIEEAISYAK